jgi:hypothetical protein
MSKDSGHGNGGNVGVKSSVADVLERDLDGVINEWLVRVEKEPELTAIPLNFEDRTGHLPQLLRDVIVRLRLDARSQAPISAAAAHRRLACETRLHSGLGGRGISPASSEHL